MTENTSPTYHVEIKDGIVYYRFMHELSIDIILAAEAEVLDMLKAQGLHLVPSIVSFVDIDPEKIDIGVTSLGRVITHRNVVSVATSVWFVGATGKIHKLASLLNTMFMNGRAHFVDTLEEAEAAAREARQQDTPMLEQ